MQAAKRQKQLDQTALHEAACSDDSDVIKLLLVAGFKIEAKSTKHYLTPLLEAAHGIAR
jgi:ankyrin repeat protein